MANRTSMKKKKKEQAKEEAEFNQLEAMQKATEAEAMNIAKEATAVMMSMGWRFDAGINVEKNEKGEVTKVTPELVVRKLNLKEWQEVRKEQLRRSLTLGK